MHKSLMFAALFATSLVAGSAAAERPAEVIRTRGDIVDKVYTKTAAKDHATRERAVERSRTSAPSKVVDPASSRWNCPTDDCHGAKGDFKAMRSEQKSQAKAEEKVQLDRVNERLAARWNCSPDVPNCEINRSNAATTSSRKPASSKDPSTERTKVEPAHKEKADPATKQKSPSEIAKGERMVQMLKAKICERLGGECGGDSE